MKRRKLTPNEVSTMTERKKTCWELSGSHHWSKNKGTSVVNHGV